jgi:hypothetical protein
MQSHHGLDHCILNLRPFFVFVTVAADIERMSHPAPTPVVESLPTQAAAELSVDFRLLALEPVKYPLVRRFVASSTVDVELYSGIVFADDVEQSEATSTSSSRNPAVATRCDSPMQRCSLGRAFKQSFPESFNASLSAVRVRFVTSTRLKVFRELRVERYEGLGEPLMLPRPIGLPVGICARHTQRYLVRFSRNWLLPPEFGA